MSSKLKNEISASEFEVDRQDLQLQSKLRSIQILDSLRMPLTILALGAAIATLGVSADSLAKYQNTQIPAEYYLPQLWPEEFDLRPTTTLVACSAIVIAFNSMSLLMGKAQLIRSRAALHTPIILAGPIASFIAALVAMSLFYAANASMTADTIHSWTCRWRNVAMMAQPHFGTLCTQSRVGMALSILLVPLEALIVGIAGYQVMLQRQVSSASLHPDDAGNKA